jgi:hypothetical protein
MLLTLDASMTLTERDPTGAAASRSFPVRLPVPGGEASVALSPDGERVGWLVYTGRPFSLIEQWLARLNPRFAFGAAPRYTLNLFVSKRDGTGVREVGRVAVSPQDRSRGALRWTPDGTRLSFVFEGALWTVPVP